MTIAICIQVAMEVAPRISPPRFVAPTNQLLGHPCYIHVYTCMTRTSVREQRGNNTITCLCTLYCGLSSYSCADLHSLVGGPEVRVSAALLTGTAGTCRGLPRGLYPRAEHCRVRAFTFCADMLDVTPREMI